MRLGSLCSGIAGLERSLDLAGISSVTEFVSDIDPHAARWLSSNIDAPNLGDLTLLDDLPDVDILTAGWPCQPVSHAGRRAGVDDERWIFDDIVRLVSAMGSRPVLFFENVYGLLTANDGRAFARVVYGLASIGYRLEYGHYAASSVGACHRRLRWWGLAVPTDTDSDSAGRVRRALHGAQESRRTEPDNDHRPPVRRGDNPLLPDTDSTGSETRIDTGPECERSRIQPLGSPAHADRLVATFGRYSAAVNRWEVVLGRAAPPPVDDEGRLDPRFVEWMMGYEDGYVTDTLVHRTRILRVLGNSVVPQAGAEAFRQLSCRVWPTSLR